jgi:THO complex subunit 3
VSLWSVEDMTCLRTFGRLEYVAYVLPLSQRYRGGTDRMRWHRTSSWPIRTLSFSFDSQFIASASEDLAIDIVCRATTTVAVFVNRC